MKRVLRDFGGTVRRIPPQETGALAQCAFCEWGRFFPDRKRKRWNCMARANKSLKAHVRKEHADKYPKFSSAEEIFA